MTFGRVVGIILLFCAILFATGSECPVQAQTVIKIGAVQPITGPLAGPGTSVNAGLADSLNMANDEGGINGKKIQYIMEDGHFVLYSSTSFSGKLALPRGTSTS